MDAFEAHTAMSSQALGSERVREGLKDTLLGPAQLYEALRARGCLVHGVAFVGDDNPDNIATIGQIGQVRVEQGRHLA